MRFQLLRSHPVDACCSLVAFHRPQRLLAVLFCYGCFHQRLVHGSPSKGSQSSGIVPPLWVRRGCTAIPSDTPQLRPQLSRQGFELASCAGLQFLLQLRSFVLRPFAPAALPAFFATSASADFSARFSPRRSPQVRCRICPLAPPGSTACVFMIFGLRCSGPACRPHPASLPVRLPAVESLPSASFSYASRLRLAVQLRLLSLVPIGSFHPIRFCPCWAHRAAASQAAQPGLAIASSPATRSPTGPSQPM